MRILIVAPRVPWPPTDGGRVAMSRLAESLAECGAELEVLSLNPRKHHVGAAPAVNFPVRAVDTDTSRRLVPLARAATSRLPFIVARFVSRAFDDALRATVRRFRPDVVQIESPFLLPYAATVRAESSARVVLRSLNVEYQIWEGLARVEGNAVRRFALRRLASSLRRYELRAMQTLDAVVPISEADADDFRRTLSMAPPMYVVPCSVKLEPVSAAAPEPDTVGFIGSLDYIPNQEAVTWILDELWPRIASAVPGARLVIAGSRPPEWLRQRANTQPFELRADVPDPAAFTRAMSVIIAPLFAGGGMRIKVLESMAAGKAVIATTIGAGGIDAVPGRDLVIADDAAAFAEAVIRLLADPAAAARLGAAARARVAERYDGRTLARGLLDFYNVL